MTVSLFTNDLKETMLNEHKILVNAKFHRTSFLPPFIMKKKFIDQTLEKFINTFINLSKRIIKNINEYFNNSEGFLGDLKH